MAATQNGKIVLSAAAENFGRRIAILVDGRQFEQAHAALDDLAAEHQQNERILNSLPLAEVPLAAIGLFPKLLATLEQCGIATVGDAIEYRVTDLQQIRGISNYSITELRARIGTFIARRSAMGLDG